MPVSPSNLPIGQITESEIVEYSDIKSFRTDSFSLEKADCQMTFYIPGDKLKAFVLYCLGGAYVDSGNNLRRLLPMYHPIWTWLWATKIVSINGEGFRGDDSASVIYSDQVTPALWEKYTVVVAFDQLPYDVLSDSDPAMGTGASYSEVNRFVSYEFIPNVQLASIENGQLIYDANGGDAWNGKPVPAQTLQIKARRETAGIKLRWWYVPAEFIHARNTLPSKLLSIQGTVNNATFFGEDAETLLCEDVKLEKFVFPFLTDAFGQLYFGYHIDFTLLWYDPTPKGKAAETRHGWNFALAPGDPSLQYYYVKTSGGTPIYTPYDFSTAFTHY